MTTSGKAAASIFAHDARRAPCASPPRALSLSLSSLSLPCVLSRLVSLFLFSSLDDRPDATRHVADGFPPRARGRTRHGTGGGGDDDDGGGGGHSEQTTRETRQKTAMLDSLLSCGYLSSILRLSCGYLSFILRLSQLYLTVISALSHRYLSFISLLSPEPHLPLVHERTRWTSN